MSWSIIWTTGFFKSREREDELVGWHHRLKGHECEQTLGEGEGQGNLARCSPWGHRESDTTEQLNNKRQISNCNIQTQLEAALQYQKGKDEPILTSQQVTSEQLERGLLGQGTPHSVPACPFHQLCDHGQVPLLTPPGHSTSQNHNAPSLRFFFFFFDVGHF